MQNKSYVQLIVIGSLILVILYLLCCNGKKQPSIPVTVPVQVIKTIVIQDTTAAGIIRDSSERVISILNKSLDINEIALAAARNKAEQLSADNDILLMQLNSDSLPSRLRKQALAMKAAAKRKDSLCNAISKDLKGKIQAKDKQLTESVKLGKKLNSLLDTCLKSQASLEKYAKDSQPRNKVALGIVTNLYPVFGYGLTADFLHKNGYIFGAYVMQMDKQTYGGISLRKVISFR